MNPTIVKIIDLMFRGIPETEETAAIREELLTNSQARYDDLLAAGESPNTALGQVLDSLRGMEEVLDEYRNNQQTNAQPTQPSEPFAELRRKAAAMGSQWEQTAEQMESKLETVADQLEEKWDTFAGKAENAAKTAWDSAMKGFRNAMDSVSGLLDEQPKGNAMPPAGVENDGIITYSFSLEEARRINVQLIGEDIEVTPSLDGWVHILIRKEDERLFLLEKSNGTLNLRRNPQSGIPADDQNEETTGLGGILTGIGKALGSIFSYARTSGDTVRLMLPHHLEQITLQTTSGDIDATGLNQRDMALSTASGDIELTGCMVDAARLGSTSGDIDVSGCTFTEVQLNTTSGDMELNSSAQRLIANTTSGDLELAGALHQLKINTVSGDVEVEIQESGFQGLTANTVSGDVSVTLPEEIIPSVNASTTSGSVWMINNDPASAIPVCINTVSGDISVDNF